MSEVMWPGHANIWGHVTRKQTANHLKHWRSRCDVSLRFSPITYCSNHHTLGIIRYHSSCENRFEIALPWKQQFKIFHFLWYELQIRSDRRLWFSSVPKTQIISYTLCKINTFGSVNLDFYTFLTLFFIIIYSWSVSLRLPRISGQRDVAVNGLNSTSCQSRS